MPIWNASETTDRRLMRAAAIAALVAGVIVVHTIVFDRPLPGVSALLVPGIPLLAAGQIRVVSIILGRRPQPSGGWLRRMRAQLEWNHDMHRFFFEGLSGRAANALLAVVLLSSVAAISAVPALARGNPQRGSGSCPWELDNHGVIACVSHAEYEAAGAAVQRFGGSILLVFFVIHFGALRGELARRRLTDADAA